MAPGWGTAATSSVPPSAWIWNCCSKSPAEIDLDLVVGVGVDQVVEDLLVGVGLLRLAGAQQLHRAGVVELASPPSPPPSWVRVAARRLVVIVAARRGEQREGEQWDHQSSHSHRGGSPWGLLLVGGVRRRRSPVPPVGSKKCRRSVSTTRSMASPFCGRRAGVEAGDDASSRRPRAWCRPAPERRGRRRGPGPWRPRSGPVGRRCGQWTTTSEPSASRSSTVVERRCSAGASGASAASSRSSGRMTDHQQSDRGGRAARVAPPASSAGTGKRSRRPSATARPSGRR